MLTPPFLYIGQVMNLMRLIGLLLSVGAVSAAQGQLSFMGYRVEIVEKPRADDFFVEAPASLCLVNEQGRRCYQAPKDFGRYATVEEVRLNREIKALLFSVASGGVSGFGIQYALLQPGSGKPEREGELENLFDVNLVVSNQSQRRFIEEPKVSEAAVFVTADYVWGMMEGHFTAHRFIVSSYVRRWDSEVSWRLFTTIWRISL